MKLLDWINIDKFCWYGLSSNPSNGAIQLLIENPNAIQLLNSKIKIKLVGDG